MKKLIVLGLLFLLTYTVSAQITGACWTLEFPDFFSGGIIPETKCTDDLTQQECMSQQGVGGIVSAVWFPMTSCDGAEPPESNESGSCAITSGRQAGQCLDEYQIFNYASSEITTYNMTSALCSSIDVMYTEGETIYVPDTECLDFMGACTFTQVGEITIDEGMCDSSLLGVEAYWQTDRCCIQGELSDNLYVNEYSCGELVNGTFHGAGSACAGIAPSETGYCRITSGTMAGLCLDETTSGDSMTEILCQQLGEVIGADNLFQANQSCSELAGACHINSFLGGGLDEATCKKLSPNAEWLGYACCVPDRIIVSTPDLPMIPSIGTTINMNEEVCEGLLGGSFQGIGVSCSQPPVDPTGACILSSGQMVGVCFDENPSTQTPLNEQACEYIAEQLGSGYEFYASQVCGDFTGACRLTQLAGDDLDEAECLGFAGNTVWLGTECCVEDELETEMIQYPLYVTEGLCESLLEGVFCGIGSSCQETTSTTQPPINAPEYPEETLPLLGIVFAVGVAFLAVKNP